MLTAQEVHKHTSISRKMIEMKNAGNTVLLKPDYLRDFQKRKFDAPTELFIVYELISFTSSHGEFFFVGTKGNCFPLNSESYCIPLLEEKGFEISETENNGIRISWERGLSGKVETQA